MSQENVEIVRRMAEAFESGGLDAARDFYHPGIEWHEDPSFPEAGVYRGVEAVEAYNQQFLREFAEIHYQPRDLVEVDDHVIGNMHIYGRGKASGAEFDMSAWWVFTVENGKVIRVQAYLDRADALEAVGLSE
jgi:uncharacterized protein